MKKLKKLFYAVKQCCKGAIAIEFAIIGTVLFTLILSIIEVGLITFSQIVVESSTNTTVRKVRLGIDGGTGDLKQYIREDIRKQASGLINKDSILITTNLDTDYNATPKPEKCLADPPAPVGSCPANAPFEDRNGNGVYDGDLPDLELGGAGDRIKIKVFYNWSIISPILYPLLGTNGFVTLTSTTFIKNEPF